jgi:hypothetical protein
MLIKKNVIYCETGSESGQVNTVEDQCFKNLKKITWSKPIFSPYNALLISNCNRNLTVAIF